MKIIVSSAANGKQQCMRTRWSNRRRGSPSALVVALGTLCLSSVAWAGGLRCSVGEVVIDNLKIAQTYSLLTLANLPLSVTNTGDQPVHVLVDAVVPDSSELRQGALPIPDVQWAQAVPDSFELAPRETRLVEMILAIPDDESLFGKKLQVTFWSHTLAQKGDLLAYGLNSRVIFTIDRVREEAGVIPTGDLAISLLPSEIILDNVVSGREYRLDEFLQEPLVIRNTSHRSLSVELRAISPEHSDATPTPGYADLLNAAEVKLSPTKLTLQPGERKTILGTVLFPKGEYLKSKGKKFMCVISAAVVDLPVQTQIYSRVYAHVQ